jgi:SAM-dependent methyltransferase
VKETLRRFFKACKSIVPKRYRLHVQTAGRSVQGIPATMMGFLRSHQIGSQYEGAISVEGDEEHLGSADENPLEAYFDAHASGPGIWKWRHYFDVYHRHFSKFVGKEVHILEIGIFSGGSLGMWKEYFGPKCRVYGVDVSEACKAYEDDTVKVFIGDQADRSFWKRFKKEVPVIDIVIDDGGHKPHQQIATLEEMLPHLRGGGVYLCEDVVFPFNRFQCYMNGFTQRLNAHIQGEEPLLAVPNETQRAVSSVHFYPYVTVIERRETAMTQLSSEQHGTEWQPPLVSGRMESGNG